MTQHDDWRLKRQRKYLQGITVRYRKFTPYRQGMSSDHCEFCWAKFDTKAQPDVLTEGYSTDDNYYWICESCFDDFHEMFEFKVIV